jgi:hypothetical protein
MLKKSFNKAFNNKSKKRSTFWQIIFYFTIFIRLIKWLFAKADPKVTQEIDLDPGEYKITVQDRKIQRKDIVK